MFTPKTSTLFSRTTATATTATTVVIETHSFGVSISVDGKTFVIISI
jgi:hypothetical protein